MFKIVPSILNKNNTLHYKQVVKWFSSVVKQSVLDENLAKQLETVSLVGFSKHSGFEVLRASVQFADRIKFIDTSKVQPLITVLESWYVKTKVHHKIYSVTLCFYIKYTSFTYLISFIDIIKNSLFLVSFMIKN